MLCLRPHGWGAYSVHQTSWLELKEPLRDEMGERSVGKRKEGIGREKIGWVKWGGEGVD